MAARSYPFSSALPQIDQRILGGLTDRVTKLSAFQFAIELSTARELSPTLSGTLSTANQLDSTTSTEGISGYEALMTLFDDKSLSDYLVVDIGAGKEWLTARVFIYAIMLERMRGISAIVFVTSKDGVYRKFLGVASPGQVRWAFANRFPWLERAFAYGYKEGIGLGGKFDGAHVVDPVHGRVPPEMAGETVQKFLNSIRYPPFPPNPIRDKDLPAEPYVGMYESEMDPRHENPWLKLPMGWQHAKWIDVDLIQNLLGATFNESWVKRSPDMPSSELTKAILRREGRFIAVVDDRMQFRRLIDRNLCWNK